MSIIRRVVSTLCLRIQFSRFLIPAVFAGSIVAVSSSLAAAQTTANIAGTVTDQSKAAIVGATVTVEAKDVAASRTTVSDAHGAYHLDALPAGSYRVTISSQGFATEVLPNLTLTLDRTVTLDISLKVGNAAEQVVVSDEPPLIDTTTPATGMTITPEQIHDIPLNGRDYLDLLQLVPGVTVNHQNDPGSVPFKLQFSSVFRVQSGFRYTASAIAPVDQDGNGNYGPRDLKTGRNQFVSPHYINQDLRIARIFAIRDRFKIQPIFELFDLFNSANPAAIQVQQSTGAQFGTVSQHLPGRQGQVALRIEF